MGGKNPKHRPLIVVAEVKKAIPGQYSIESPTKGKDRMSATIHSWPGIRLRQSEISVGEASTPVTWKPLAAM
jgi:hypothetical protein